MVTLVGLSGYARSGKDTLAAALRDEGWNRVAFADKLREVLYALNPMVTVKVNTYEVEEASSYKPIAVYTNETPVYVQDVIDLYTWDRYKETEYGPEIRRLLQRLGTEAGRQALWDSIWVDAAMKAVDNDPYGKYVVTDCRFPNEARAIQERDGFVIRITRPGVGPANSHASETSLDDWRFDGHITNDGIPKDMVQQLKEILG